MRTYTKHNNSRLVEMLLTSLVLKGHLFRSFFAQVAELVDAQVSGTCGGNPVEVRVFSWAPALFFLSIKFFIALYSGIHQLSYNIITVK